MSKDVVLGIIRHVLTTGAGALVADGLMTGSEASDGVGAIVVLIGIGWSAYDKWQRAKAAAALAITAK